MKWKHKAEQRLELVNQLLTALRHAEWYSPSSYDDALCPVCEGWKAEGHYEHCTLREEGEWEHTACAVNERRT